MSLRYGSVCTGIKAEGVAWAPLGWTPVFNAEIDPRPCAVLNHHWSEVPNLGDFTKIETCPEVDLLMGGTPCQDFSIAGLRAGMGGDRGKLTLEFLQLAGRQRPRWLVWENVPGALLVDGGLAFGAFLGGLAKLGYGFAWRVLDAQYVRVDGYPRAVPQRRRRVFVVGYLGDWRRAGAVLFERGCLSGHPAPGREAGPGSAVAVEGGPGSGGRVLANRVIPFDTTQITSDKNYSSPQAGDPCRPLAATTDFPAIAFEGGPGSRREVTAYQDVGWSRWRNGLGPISSHDDNGTNPVAIGGDRPRRLMPVECERLQGFPDGYTAVPYRGKTMADSSRRFVLGNSIAINVLRWIGLRIEMVRQVPGGGR